MIDNVRDRALLTFTLLLLSVSVMPAHAGAKFKVSSKGVATITLTSASEQLTLTGLQRAAGRERPPITYIYTVDSLETEGTLEGVTGNVTIDAKGGDNTVTITQGFPNNLIVKSGSGNDQFKLENCSIGNDLKLLPNSGNDLIDIHNCSVGDDAQINTSGGDDDLLISGFGVPDILNITTGAGDDEVTISDGTASFTNYFDGNATITTGTGEDSVILGLSAASGLGIIFGSRLKISMGGGMDYLQVGNSSFFGPAVFNTGAGNDEVFLGDYSYFDARAEFNGSSSSGDIYRESGERIRFESVNINKGFEIVVIGEDPDKDADEEVVF